MKEICEYIQKVPMFKQLEEMEGKVFGKVFITNKVPGYYEALDEYGIQFEMFRKTTRDGKFTKLPPEEQDFVILEAGDSAIRKAFKKSGFIKEFEERIKRVMDNPPERLEKYLEVARSYRKTEENLQGILENKVYPYIPEKIVVSDRLSLLGFPGTIGIYQLINHGPPKAFIDYYLNCHGVTSLEEILHRSGIESYYFGARKEGFERLVESLEQGDEIVIVPKKDTRHGNRGYVYKR